MAGGGAHAPAAERKRAVFETGAATDRRDDGALKLIDFGHAVRCDGRVFNTLAGKNCYMAPEIQACGRGGQRSYDARAADVWSLGVVLFILLTGCPPFDFAAAGDARFELVARGKLRFIIESWGYISKFTSVTGALPLVERMLCADPQQRATMDEVMISPFVAEVAAEDTAEDASECAVEGVHGEKGHESASSPVSVALALALDDTGPLLSLLPSVHSSSVRESCEHEDDELPIETED